PSGALAAVVGSNPLPRTEVTKKIWDYIRKNKLQDSINRRLINADDKLRQAFGGKKQVSMFEMTKLVSNHLKSRPVARKKSAKKPAAKQAGAKKPTGEKSFAKKEA